MEGHLGPINREDVMHGQRGRISHKGGLTFGRIIGALAIGYLAAGITWEVLPFLFIAVLPRGSITISADTLRGILALPSIAVWVFVSWYFIKRWRQPPETGSTSQNQSAQ
jgi:formate hydrogenlyase subunit 3/multisubunit Na+/H+ antiporter MnhD subunit